MFDFISIEVTYSKDREGCVCFLQSDVQCKWQAVAQAQDFTYVKCDLQHFL